MILNPELIRKPTPEMIPIFLRWPRTDHKVNFGLEWRGSLQNWKQFCQFYRMVGILNTGFQIL